MGGPAAVSRRSVMLAAAAAVALPACTPAFTGTRLVLATGNTQGVYYTLGTALAQAWQQELAMDVPPEVQTTAGSVDNLSRLVDHRADVAFSQIDTAADLISTGGSELVALARIYDDALHAVVRADSPTTTLGGLRGTHVSVGAPDSGVLVIAKRLLTAAGLSLEADLHAVEMGLDESMAAMMSGEIDAFFWSGGLPTGGVTRLSAHLPIRLLDLRDIVPAVRAAHSVYEPGTVPARTYGIPDPVTTILVRNVLLVRSSMPDELAAALVGRLFHAQELLAAVSPAALMIDPRAAIGTQPVPLHAGAVQFFQSLKQT